MMRLTLWLLVIGLFTVFMGMLIYRIVASNDTSSWDTTNVYEMQSDEVEKLISSGKRSTIMFGATWCPHCKALKPMINQLSAQFPQSIFATVDADSNRELIKKMGVRAFPAVYQFKGEKRLANSTDPSRTSKRARRASKKLGRRWRTRRRVVHRRDVVNRDTHTSAQNEAECKYGTFLGPGQRVCGKFVHGAEGGVGLHAAAGAADRR